MLINPKGIINIDFMGTPSRRDRIIFVMVIFFAIIILSFVLYQLYRDRSIIVGGLIITKEITLDPTYSSNILLQQHHLGLSTKSAMTSFTN